MSARISRRGRSADAPGHQRLSAARGRDPAHARVAGSSVPSGPRGRAVSGRRRRRRRGRGGPYRVFRQPERFLWPTPGVGRRLHDAVRSFGADVVLFGAVYPLALLGPSLAEAGTPYLAAAHGFEYWLDLAGNARARAAGHLPSGTGAGDVQRVHRSGRPDGRPGRGAGLGDVPGRGRGGVPAGPAVRGSHRSARRRGPTARRLREPARRTQGTGRVDPRDARDPPPRPRCRVADRGRRPRPGTPGAPGLGCA